MPKSSHPCRYKDSIDEVSCGSKSKRDNVSSSSNKLIPDYTKEQFQLFCDSEIIENVPEEHDAAKMCDLCKQTKNILLMYSYKIPEIEMMQFSSKCGGCGTKQGELVSTKSLMKQSRDTKNTCFSLLSASDLSSVLDNENA